MTKLSQEQQDEQATQIRDKISINYHFSEIEEPTYATIKEIVEHFISHKVSSYLVSELKHEDARLHIDIHLRKNKQWLFEWACNFDFETARSMIRYETSQPFKKLDDVLSHAFSHLKERLAHTKPYHDKHTYKEKVDVISS